MSMPPDCPSPPLFSLQRTLNGELHDSHTTALYSSQTTIASGSDPAQTTHLPHLRLSIPFDHLIETAKQSLPECRPSMEVAAGVGTNVKAVKSRASIYSPANRSHQPYAAEISAGPKKKREKFKEIGKPAKPGTKAPDRKVDKGLSKTPSKWANSLMVMSQTLQSSHDSSTGAVALSHSQPDTLLDEDQHHRMEYTKHIPHASNVSDMDNSHILHGLAEDYGSDPRAFILKKELEMLMNQLLRQLRIAFEDLEQARCNTNIVLNGVDTTVAKALHSEEFMHALGKIGADIGLQANIGAIKADMTDAVAGLHRHIQTLHQATQSKLHRDFVKLKSQTEEGLSRLNAQILRISRNVAAQQKQSQEHTERIIGRMDLISNQIGTLTSSMEAIAAKIDLGLATTAAQIQVISERKPIEIAPHPAEIVPRYHRSSNNSFGIFHAKKGTLPATDAADISLEASIFTRKLSRKARLQMQRNSAMLSSSSRMTLIRPQGSRGSSALNIGSKRSRYLLDLEDDPFNDEMSSHVAPPIRLQIAPNLETTAPDLTDLQQVADSQNAASPKAGEGDTHENTILSGPNDAIDIPYQENKSGLGLKTDREIAQPPSSVSKTTAASVQLPIQKMPSEVVKTRKRRPPKKHSYFYTN